MTFYDGFSRTIVYDEAGDVTKYTDENDSMFNKTLDSLGRKTVVAMARASGVSGTTARSFWFNGLSRMTFAQDSMGGTNAVVTIVSDSLNRVVNESETY